jgi:ABC-type molybdate transport system, periplasmic component
MDVVITADSFLIPQYLIPAYASWYTEFATNKLVLCYTDKSAYAKEITSNNWFDILLRKDVDFGYAEPNLDPCGYRTLLMFQLAELFYKKPGLYNSLLNATKPKISARNQSNLLHFFKHTNLITPLSMNLLQYRTI